MEWSGVSQPLILPDLLQKGDEFFKRGEKRLGDIYGRCFFFYIHVNTSMKQVFANSIKVSSDFVSSEVTRTAPAGCIQQYSTGCRLPHVLLKVLLAGDF